VLLGNKEPLLNGPQTSVELYIPHFVQQIRNPTDLAFLGVQQDRAAASAGIVHRVIARYEHGRSIQHDTKCWRGDCFKVDFLRSGHAGLPATGGSTELSATDAWAHGRCR
jgi:hypothetical protein